MDKRFPTKLPLFLFVTCLLSCGTVRVYEDQNKLLFCSNEKENQASEKSDSLSLLTFNIKEAEKIQLAILELKQFEKAKNIDILLLQEMDEKGAKAIAGELNLNYLYIPIVYNRLIKKNIGNAILTKGIIEHPEKLILPHTKWVNKRRRHVTVGEISLHQKKILVYSVHTETSSMSRKSRMDQIDAIIENVKKQLPNYKYFLIGGDFNTLFSKDGNTLVEKFKENGFDWSTANAGSTAKAFFGLIKPRLDYIFSRGLQVIDNYKIDSSRSSDHYPIFATFKY